MPGYEFFVRFDSKASALEAGITLGIEDYGTQPTADDSRSSWILSAIWSGKYGRQVAERRVQEVAEQFGGTYEGYKKLPDDVDE